MASGGDIIEITVNHPDLGSRVFHPKANEGNTFDDGGVRTNDDESQITAKGNPIYQQNMVRGSLEVLLENDQNERNDAQFISDLHKSPKVADYTVSIINGTVWAFQGKPVGENKADVNAATVPLKLAFGKAKKIV